jgi:hypothetical protein
MPSSPREKDLHLILDNYGTHGHERVRRRLKQHPRFVLHFIPTGSSWLNLIERWFAELSQKTVRRGVFHSMDELQRAVADFLAAWNAVPAPFVWTASVEAILEKSPSPANGSNRSSRAPRFQNAAHQRRSFAAPSLNIGTLRSPPLMPTQLRDTTLACEPLTSIPQLRVWFFTESAEMRIYGADQEDGGDSPFG